MSNTPHTLHDEFPNDALKISALKGSNTHFARADHVQSDSD